MKVRVTLVDSEYEGVVTEDDLDKVGLMKLAVFVDDNEGDVVLAGISPEARRDFVDGAIHRGLDGSEVVVIEGFTTCGGNMRRLYALDGCKRDLVMLDQVPSERARCIWARWDVSQLGFWIGEGIVLAVEGSGVRGLLILWGRDEERSKTVVGEGLRLVVISSGSIRSIPSHLS